MCGRTGANPKVKSAIVISVPWQLDVAYQQLQQNLVNRYTINYYISNKIRNLLTRWVGHVGRGRGWRQMWVLDVEQ